MKKLKIFFCTSILFLGLMASAQADQKGPRPNTNAPPTPVPEPVTLALLGGGLVGLYALKKKFDKD